MSHRQRGATAGEILFVVLIFCALGFLVWLALPRRQPPPAPPTASRYACLTTPDGVVPLKALITPADGTVIRRSPEPHAERVRVAPMFSTWFAGETNNGWVRLAVEPVRCATVGWVPQKEVLMWATKEALQPNYANPSRRRFDLWNERADAGIPDRPGFNETDNETEPRPVLEADGGHYKVAMIWEEHDYSKHGVATAWTAKLEVPDDVRFFYLTTRDELARDIQDFNEAIVQLGSGSSSDHPVLRILKENIDVRVGRDVTTEGDDVGTVRRILRELRGPSRIADRQPAEIRRDAEKMRQRLKRLRRFYEERENWNEQGFGWLPSEYLPGN